MKRALFIAHDWDPVRTQTYPGLLGSVLQEWGWEVEVHSFLFEDRGFVTQNFDFLVVLGAAESATDTHLPWLQEESAFIHSVMERGVPTFGVCFGAQLLSTLMGGSVYRLDDGEFGAFELNSFAPKFVTPGPWLEIHGEGLNAPPQSTVLAETAACTQGFLAPGVMGVQFHPEIDRPAFESLLAKWRETGSVNALKKFGMSRSEVLELIDQFQDLWRFDIKMLLSRFFAVTGISDVGEATSLQRLQSN